MSKSRTFALTCIGDRYAVQSKLFRLSLTPELLEEVAEDTIQTQSERAYTQMSAVADNVAATVIFWLLVLSLDLFSQRALKE
ncbi:MAG: hypothetical protein ABJM86_12020 [Hyphomicrobiales bacterium]